MTRSLPSLKALRTFEAVSRHGSFTSAAEELNVTQSAVSRMIKALEDDLALQLFERTGRQIRLTEEGVYYSAKIAKAMDLIEVASRELVDTRAGRGTLSIGMLPTFGTQWLLPRLNAFLQLHPELTVDIRSSDGKLDFSQERIDVAIRFGYDNWPDARAEPLMSEELQVVCSPRVMDGPYPLTSYDQLRRHNLIVHSSRSGTWSHWLQAVGANPEGLQYGLRLEHFYMVLQAVKSGLGVGLLPSYLAADDVASGSLIAPFPARVVSPGGYYLVTPWDKADLSRVQAFRAWVMNQV
ncbi:MAG: transcriptional regulator GcvA [Rhodobacteraceae bacterium]|jgi:LysR family glycine cleavage system transcriptional activator|nr:transcriptional regulator GcvA [Paracoccaceae bacterium]